MANENGGNAFHFRNTDSTRFTGLMAHTSSKFHNSLSKQTPSCSEDQHNWKVTIRGPEKNHTLPVVYEYLIEFLLSCKTSLVTFDYNKVNAVQMRIFLYVKNNMSTELYLKEIVHLQIHLKTPHYLSL